MGSSDWGIFAHSLILINIIVATYIDKDNHIVLNDEVDDNTVLHIDRDGMVRTKFSLQFVQTQRWMVWVAAQNLYGLFILRIKLFVLFKKLNGFFLIPLSKAYLSHL